jgi:hypothetical protein
VSTGPKIPDVVTPPRPITETTRRVETVTTVNETNPRLNAGAIPSPEGHKLVLIVTNVSDKLLPFRFPSGQDYDFIIEDSATGREVWRWSKGQFFTQVVRSEGLRANAKWTYEVVWNHRDNDGNPVPPGEYHLVGVVASQPPIRSARTIFDVQ